MLVETICMTQVLALIQDGRSGHYTFLDRLFNISNGRQAEGGVFCIISAVAGIIGAFKVHSIYSIEVSLVRLSLWASEISSSFPPSIGTRVRATVIKCSTCGSKALIAWLQSRSAYFSRAALGIRHKMVNPAKRIDQKTYNASRL